jgi:hypothetical protein
MTPEKRYAALVAKLTAHDGVTSITEGKGFGSSGQLKVKGRIFAMLVRDELVLKLPSTRVAELVALRQGVHFDAGKGRPMKEWFVLSAGSTKPWAALAQEALDFVSAT